MPCRPAGERVARGRQRRQVRGGHAELFRGRHRGLLGRRGRQRALDRVPHELVDRARIAKANFDLLRVYVDVHATRIDVEPQRVARLPLVMEDVPIGLAERVREDAIAHEPPVDENILRTTLRRVGGPHREAGQPYPARVGVDARRVRHELVAQELFDARLPATCREPVHDAAVVLQGERSLRVREGDAPERLVAMAPFRRFGAQELAPRGRVEEQLLHGHRGAFGQRRRRDRRHGAALDLDAPCVRAVDGARRERKPRDRGDGGQRLAAEAQRRDPFEIHDRPDLRCRVTRYRKGEVLALDAAPVVRDPDALDAARGEIDLDVRGASVEGVLEQLLQRRRRPLDHLPRGDLADEEIGQRTDRRHYCESPCAQRA